MPRVVAGLLKGLRLNSPVGLATRPTADKVKEAIFSILAALSFDFVGARVMDFFAGSGALALEALSRGAASAVITDHNPLALITVNHNLAAACRSLDLDVLVLKTTWPRGFEYLGAARPFNLFFLDPPYAERQLPLKLLKEVARRSLAVPGALAVWEQAPETLAALTPAEAAPWRIVRIRAWSKQAAVFMEYQGY
ncbi:MAG: hypothetical protein AMR96_03075 [Candidatus Adiutrix intracellularis]|nr:MAG: hypothetical protein AMR96_03075 [Candidatus Adiutrix intracellularis]